MKTQNTYQGWDFTGSADEWGSQPPVWAIDSDRNGGFPYLKMEDDLPSGVQMVALTGLTLSQTTFSLGVGDTAYLSAVVTPINAALPTLTWTSSDLSVAELNNSGRVSAVGAGTAIITVSGGGFSAKCTVTVSARTPDEYRIGSLTIRDTNGAELMAIPTGQFTVTIPVTKLTAGGNTVVFLAAYGAGGQYKGLLYVTIEDIPVGATVKVTLPVDNTKGEITQLKAFPIASFSNLVPVGATSCFPVQ
jgi:hypothetical protein